ncbi:uncharacterized protein METZ01_LOCUS460252 [marine metagenome]|uniref:phosphoribosyl-ATP diphosphatase n=1 Tax=marine metagenome TaxID=408172 RepID=A0A383AJX9_9ZZZZ
MNSISDNFIFQLEEIIQERINNPIKGSYTNTLLDGGRKLIAKKLIEESGELAVAYLDDNSSSDDIIWEASDLIYHMLVLLQSSDLSLNEISGELANRHKEK